MRAPAASFAPSIAGLFTDPAEQVQREAEERRKRALAAARVGVPGSVSTMLGYFNDTRDRGDAS